MRVLPKVGPDGLAFTGWWLVTVFGFWVVLQTLIGLPTDVTANVALGFAAVLLVVYVAVRSIGNERRVEHAHN